LPVDARFIVCAKLDARDSIDESKRAAAVKGLDDQLANTTLTLATTPGTYKIGTLARIADAYDATGEPDKAASTRRLAVQESALASFAQASADRQQRMINELPPGALRDSAQAIQRHQADAFARDAFTAGTTLYPEVGPPVPIDDIKGRIRQAREIAEMRGVRVVPFTADEIDEMERQSGQGAHERTQGDGATEGLPGDNDAATTGPPDTSNAQADETPGGKTDPNIVLAAGDDKEKRPRLPGAGNRPDFGRGDSTPMPLKQIDPLARPGATGGGFRFPRLQGSSPKGNEPTSKSARSEGTQPSGQGKASVGSAVGTPSTPGTVETPSDPSGRTPRVSLPSNEAQIRHIFREKEGHLPDVPENRRLLEDIASDKDAILGLDRWGNTWSGRIMPDGTQVWTRSRNGVITNGGVNSTPKTYNPQTGLSSPIPKGRQK